MLPSTRLKRQYLCEARHGIGESGLVIHSLHTSVQIFAYTPYLTSSICLIDMIVYGRYL